MKNTSIVSAQGRTHISPKFWFLALTFFLVLFYSKLLFSATIYIDPTNTTSGQNGTISNPYDSWTDFSLVSGNTYLQKRSTTYTSSTNIYIGSKSNIIIGTYGSGNRPIFSYTGSTYAFHVEYSSGCTIENFEVNGNTNAHSLIRINGAQGNETNNITINNCLLYNAHNANNAGFGIHGGRNNNLSILNTEMHNIALDGMYLSNCLNLEIGYCNIYDMNRRYFINPNQTYSSGDGIQLDGNYNGFHLHHTTVNRTNGAGNKFNVILASAVGTSNNAFGIIEYCTFVTDTNVSTALMIEMGNGIITRYNKFMGVTQGIRLGGAYTSNNLIHNNIFSNCTSGIGIGYKYPSVGPATNTKVYNNVFYHVSNYHIWLDKTYVETRNNIHVRTTDAGVAIYNYGGGTWTISNNCYSSAATAGTPGTGSNPVIGDPLFISPSTGNFNIQSNSPCINKGTNVGIPFDYVGTAIFQGTAPEIGSYEYLNSSGSNLPPVINNQSFSVNENIANGTPIGTVVASDPNSGQTLTYSITGGNTNNAFIINASTGVLSVNNSQALNYEVITVFPLIVRVTDNGSPVLYTQATVTINVQNVNETPAIANQAFSVFQNSPNGNIVGTVVATDPDAGQTLAYSITGGNTNTCFAINSSSGAITVSNSTALNPQTFSLTVRATDNGSPVLYSQATVTIVVTQVNQPPVIANQAFSVVQNLPNGTLVGTVVATDPNAGQTLTFSITGGNTNTCFAINSSSGVITVGNSTALNPQTFSLTVRATDNGSPVLYSQATVTIVVTQANQPPVISNQAFSVVQNLPNGTLVGTVVATDPNAGQTLTFSITGGNTNTCFAINSSSGVITVGNSTALNPQTFSLTVRATDNGSPVLYSQATVTIVVTQANQPPVISNQAFSVVQNLPNGTLVGTVVATDPNAGQTLTFSITGGNTNTCFAINSSSGVITVGNSTALNPQTFSLTVRATDNGSPVLYSQATVTIVVTQANQPPVISNQAFLVQQYSPVGTLVGTITASDPDPGQSLSYSLTAGNSNGIFAINPANGNITVLNSSALYPRNFYMIARVTDNGNPSLFSEATITVTVTPINYAPDISNQTFSVVQYAPVGTLVGSIVATDPNQGQVLTYTATAGNSNGIFGINPTNGNITVLIPSALYPRSFYIQIRVTDNGNPSLFSEATITITVIQSSNMPQYHSQEFTFSDELLSGSPVGTVVVNNQSDNQSLSYNLPDEMFGTGFDINSTTGQISIANPEDISIGINQIRVIISDSTNQDLIINGNITIFVTETTADNTSNLNTGFSETPVNIEAILSPNPSYDGIFRLNFENQLSSILIQAFDLSGKMIVSFVSESSNDVIVDLSSQPKGVYILKVQKGGILKEFKAIIS
ncbi:MAG: cadherin domain-containing protein [Lentimicrobium sp.]